MILKSLDKPFSWDDPNLTFDDAIPNPSTQIQTQGVNAGLPVGVSANVKLIPSLDPQQPGSIIIEYPTERVVIEDTL